MNKIILAKMGLDGHDKGIKIIAKSLRDTGNEVIYLGLRQSAEAIIQAAIQEDAKVIGISVLSGNHLSLAKKLVSSMKANQVNFRILFGGTISWGDISILKKLGITDVFPVESNLKKILQAFQVEKPKEHDSTFPIPEHIDSILKKVETDVRTDSNIPVKISYTQKDITSFCEKEDLGLPGHYPYTRGPYETMYRGRVWTMRQYAGLGTAIESNRRYQYLLSQGQTGLSVAFDLPTQLGFDSDSSEIADEVGRVGVALDTVEDMYTLFENIPLDKVSVSFTINSTAIIIFAMFMVMAEERGYDPKMLSGTVQNDMIKEFLSRNTFIFPLKPSLKLTADIIAFSSQYLPKFNPISCAGYHIRELGANAIQELATTLGAATVYIQEVLERGIPVDHFAPRLSFELACHQDFFEEIAKFRAARRMWAKIMKHQFKAKNEKSLKFRVFSGGNGISLTAQEPLNNIIRGAFQCLAGALGGSQAIHVPAYDEAYAIPSQESALICLRTQQITAYETGITKTADPLAGSYYIEHLTCELEKKANELMQKMDKMGGLVKCIETGWIMDEIIKAAYQKQQAIDARRKIIVGVNRFTSKRPDGKEIQIEKISSSILNNQIKKLKKVKKERDYLQVKTKLNQLSQAALGSENLFPFILEAVRVRATVGETVCALKKVYGEYKGI